MAALRYTFRTHPTKGYGRTVTVYANDIETAKDKARNELDRRVEKSGGEPPVGWDLFLVKKKINWAKPKK